MTVWAALLVVMLLLLQYWLTPLDLCSQMQMFLLSLMLFLLLLLLVCLAKAQWGAYLSNASSCLMCFLHV